jgi:pimeloyl-ACP methyl ester carboxylesterase
MPSHSVLEFGKALLALFKLDPVGLGLTLLTWRPAFVRNPKRAARLLLSKEAVYSPDAFYARLSPGSLLALYQHNPPFWRPPKQVDTPILWLTGDQDVAVSPAAQRRSAAYYRADHRTVPGAGHNLMMEHNYRQTAETVHHWLTAQEIA